MKTPQELNELADGLKRITIGGYGQGVIDRAAHELRHMAQLQKELKDEREYSEGLAADICKMEDALGFKNECHDKDGAFVPTIGPWLERVRDLLAAEGELGDIRTTVSKLENTLNHRAQLEAEHLADLQADLHEAAELLQVARFLDRTLWDRRDSFLAKLNRT